MELCVVRKFFENDFNVMLITNKERQEKYPGAIFLWKNNKTNYDEFAIGNSTLINRFIQRVADHG